MMRANSPGAVAVSAGFHAAVAAAFTAVALLFSAGGRAINGAEFVFVPRNELVFPASPSVGAPPPVSASSTVRFNPSVVPRPVILPPMAVPAADRVADSIPRVPPAKGSSAERVTYSQYLRQHGRTGPAVQSSAASTAPTFPSVPQIDATSMVAELLDSSTSTDRPVDGGSAAATQLQAYFSRLVAALRAAHAMPAEVDALEVARVSFFLAADGAISAVKLVSGSGNAAYDRSVLAAFRLVRSIGAVPGGCSGVYEVRFRMVE